jgi:hypothetical protein
MERAPTAPPRGDIIRKEEANFVAGPRPLTQMAKIVGNMMASKA